MEASASSEFATARDTSPKPIGRFIALCCLSLLVTPQNAPAEWVEWIADGNLETQFNDNLNRSGFSSDTEEDTSLVVEGLFGRVNQLSGTLRFSAAAKVRAEIFDEFDGLDSKSIGTSLALRKKFGTGLTVPWGRLSLDASYLDVKDDIRSGMNVLADLQLGKRYSERMEASGGIRLKARNGKTAPSASPPIGGNVFDQDSWEVYVSGSYLLTERILGSLGLAYFDGEIDSACNAGNVAEVVANEELKGITKDNVFGGCVYRLEVDALTYSLGASYALGRHNSINFDYRYQDGETSYQSYKNTIYTLSYKYSY